MPLLFRYIYFLFFFGIFGIVNLSGQSTDQNFAVVELFTSQGCSSCPPADKVLEELSEEYEDEAVFFLAFHVDYWDHLGWKDKFSQSKFSEYQRTYAQKLPGRVYTPQMIVNGESAFVGSGKNQAEQAILNALKKTKNNSLSIQSEIEGGILKIYYEVKRPKEGCRLNLALVEKEETTTIKSGENGGKKLRYTHIARDFIFIEPNEKGRESFDISTYTDLGKLSVVAYYQDKKNYSIISAAQTYLK